MQGSAGAAGAAFDAVGSVFDPGVARARELLEQEKRKVVQAPSPGEDFFRTGVIRLRRSPPAEASRDVKDA